MRIGIARAVLLSAAALWLAGCSASGKFSNPFESKTDGTEAFAAAPANEDVAKEQVPPPLGVPAASEAGLLGSDPNDALNLGKKQYRADNFGLAEKYFRKAAELHPRDAEAWLGLAASYDRLRRFDLADRAYGQAIGILGPTTAILNNQGYSYMLRGDYKRARTTLNFLTIAAAFSGDDGYETKAASGRFPADKGNAIQTGRERRCRQGTTNLACHAARC
jgi:tetratricopeptide (TPR) repeat protein